MLLLQNVSKYKTMIRGSILILIILNIDMITADNRATCNDDVCKPEGVDFTRWSYEKDRTTLFAHFNEEILVPFPIAIINCIDCENENDLTVGNFMQGSNNALGAKIVKEDDKYVLKITQRQDHENENQRSYRYEITKSGKNMFDVSHSINDIDDVAPSIIVETSPCVIPENGDGFGASDCTYKIIDPDTDMENIKLSISNFEEFFQVEFDQKIYGTDAIALLHVIKELDFEKQSMYFFDIIAEDTGPQKGNASIIIKVKDVSDEPPVWNLIFATKTFEEHSKTGPYEVLAKDGDFEIDAEVDYEIDCPHDNITITRADNGSGFIHIGEIDRDEPELLDNTIKCELTAFETENKTSNIKSEVLFIVKDINDNKPLITFKTDTEIYLNEGETTQISEFININDKDQGDNAQLDVEIIDDHNNKYSKAFQIIPNSGYKSFDFSLSVIKPELLDYDNEEWRNFKLKIKSKDRGTPPETDEKEFSIYLYNQNNKLPYFETTKFDTKIFENATNNTDIINILAKDDDTDDYITYELPIGNDKFGLRKEANKSVTIITKTDNVFDFEKQETVFLQIIIYDNLNSSEGINHTLSQQITINVLDVNDETPRITLPEKTLEIEENEEPGTEIKSLIKAEDVDTDAELKFSIIWENSYSVKEGKQNNDKTKFENVFEIITTYENDGNKDLKGKAIGTLKVKEKEKLDYEIFETLYLAVQVEDKNQIVNSGIDNARVPIIIIDLNDNAPIFKNLTNKALKVDENSLQDTLIGSVYFYDIDGPGNNVVRYSIEPIDGTQDDLVQIDEETGEITVKKDKGIDADKPKTFELYYKVIADDSVNQTPENIIILVNDLNDCTPRLDSEMKSISIDEGNYNDYLLLTVPGVDDDRDKYNNVIQYLLAGDNEQKRMFYINEKTGAVYANNTFLWTPQTKEIVVKLLLMDNFGGTGESRTFSTDFTLKITDIDNNPPVLQETLKFDEIKEISENGKVATITATDADEPCTKRTTIEYQILEIRNTHNDTLIDNDLFIINNVALPAPDCVQTGEISVNKKLEGYYGKFSMTIEACNPNNRTSCDKQKYPFDIQANNFKTPKILFPTNDPIILDIVQTPGQQLKKIDGRPLENFIATDQQNDKFTMYFSEVDGDWDTFELKNLDESRAQLLLKKVADNTNYNLTIKAEHNGIGLAPREITQTFTVIFVDENILPEFPEPAEDAIDIQENKISFCDEFKAAVDSKCYLGAECVHKTYYFLNTRGEMENFEINLNKPEICLKTALDFEKQRFHDLKIVATNDEKDNTVPSDYVPLSLRINVVDINDNPPVFDSNFFSGVLSPSKEIDSVVVTVTATDIDTVDKDKLTYTIVEDSLHASHSSIKGINEPFYIKENTNIIRNNFKAQPTMEGFFTFNVQVFDSDDLHSDTTEVKVFIISDKNTVSFTFDNDYDTVNPRSLEISNIFTDVLQYTCTIYGINQKTSESGEPIVNQTEVKTHFIDPQNEEPVSEADISVKISDVQTLARLKVNFETIGLTLNSVKDNVSENIKNVEELLRTLLIVVSVVLGTLIIILFVAFILRTRSLKKRIESMTQNVFGSTKSDLNRIGVNAPGTNKHAVEANPVWNEDIKNADNISQTSGGSDLIGIEDNPEFDYNYNKDDSIFHLNVNNGSFRSDTDSLSGSTNKFKF